MKHIPRTIAHFARSASLLAALMLLASCASQAAPAQPQSVPRVSHNADWTPTIEEFGGVKMALVPPGCFQMGSTDLEIDDVMDKAGPYVVRESFEAEQPAHQVCFDEPFWIDVYEVTNAQVGGNRTLCLGPSSEDNQPVICLDWNEATSHCLSRGARLPTEAEWEYAARGPDSLIFPWGNAWNTDNVIEDRGVDGGTAVVGSAPGGVSWVGAYDLLGNVWEWVGDWYDPAYYGTLPDGVVNPQGSNAGEYRVLRGGSYFENEPAYFHAAYRWAQRPDEPSTDWGFRCARSY